jgi:hypothetical protein
LSARLLANKKEFILDRQGMTAEQYRKAIETGKVSLPEVNFALEVTNTTKKDLRVRISGAVPKLILYLKGKGVVTRSTTEPRQKVADITLKPGQSHSLAITTLTGIASTRRTQFFWTEAGEYTLTAEWQTRVDELSATGRVLPVVGGPAAWRKTATAEPIKLRVKLK